MPLDGAYFIKDLDPSNPVGTIDKVSLLDDIIREVKGTIVNTFPDMDGEVKYSTDELNDMKANFVREDGEWDMKGNVVKGVGDVKDDSADDTVVLNRKNSDARYLMADNNLSDLKDVNEAFDNLFKEVDYTSDGVKAFRAVMTNLMYPVGSLYMNVQTDQNPAEYLGVGTWVRFAEGRALIGVGELNDGYVTKTFECGNVVGTFEHTLTIEQMPSHNHDIRAAGKTVQGFTPGGSHGGTSGGGRGDQEGNIVSNHTGNSKPHPNMQPSIAVHVWRRTE